MGVMAAMIEVDQAKAGTILDRRIVESILTGENVSDNGFNMFTRLWDKGLREVGVKGSVSNSSLMVGQEKLSAFSLKENEDYLSSARPRRIPSHGRVPLIIDLAPVPTQVHEFVNYAPMEIIRLGVGELVFQAGLSGVFCKTGEGYQVGPVRVGEIIIPEGRYVTEVVPPYVANCVEDSSATLRSEEEFRRGISRILVDPVLISVDKPEFSGINTAYARCVYACLTADIIMAANRVIHWTVSADYLGRAAVMKQKALEMLKQVGQLSVKFALIDGLPVSSIALMAKAFNRFDKGEVRKGIWELKQGQIGIGRGNTWHDQVRGLDLGGLEESMREAKGVLTAANRSQASFGLKKVRAKV